MRRVMKDAATKANELICRGKISDAISLLREAAEACDSDAKFCLGLLYYRGKKVPGDFEESWKWLDAAYEAGHPKAPYYLGRFVAWDGGYENAIEWYLISAERGYHVALARLGLCFLKGIGVDKSDDIAFDYFTRANEAGNVWARLQCERINASRQKGFMRVVAFVSGHVSYLRYAVRSQLKHKASNIEEINERFAA